MEKVNTDEARFKMEAVSSMIDMIWLHGAYINDVDKEVLDHYLALMSTTTREAITALK